MRHQSSASRPVPLEAIGGHLEKVLSSGVFKTADSLRELLRFTVNETLAGRSGGLKEYVLGATVLERGDSFDPKADPIVRIQMRRLRDHLNRYYATEGRYDPVVIDIPSGTYVPTFRSSARDAAVAAPASADERFIVGREKELMELRAAFASAAGGRGQVFGLTGEPGIGKTTVVEMFLREVVESGVACFCARGRCSERLAGSEAYLPVMEALEALLRGGDESLRRLMSAVAPTWYAQIGPLAEDNASKRTAAERRVPQERLKRELTAFFEELQRRRPTVIFFDDLHWADDSTIDLLAYLSYRSASWRILIVGAYRSAELFVANHPFQRVKLELQLHGMYHESPMPFLTSADAARYLALLFPDHLFPEELSTQIHERTEGNPLFMADLVRFLRDRGVLTEREGRWVMAGRLPELESEIPASVRSMIEKKIRQLSDTDRRLLVAASVEGHTFDSAVVSKALAMDAVDVEDRLDVLERVHFFVRFVSEREFPDRTLTLRYRFVHVLYQNVLYATLRPARKASLSAAVADALLGYYGAQHAAIASEVAMLFEAAREFDRAAEYFLLASQQAARVSAYRETVVLARRGLSALTRSPQTPERAQRELRLQTALGPALMSTVGHANPEVQATYVRARELCHEVGDAPDLFRVTWGLWQYWTVRAEYQTCRELGEQLLAWAQKLNDPALLLMAHGSLANTFGFTGDFERCRTHADQCIAIYDPRQHHALAAVYGGHDPGVGCRGSARAVWLLGYPDQALQRSQDAITLARELAHPYSLALALIWDAMVHQHRRDAQRTREQAEAAIAVATEHEFSLFVLWATALRGWALTSLGKTSEGIAQLRRGVDGWSAIGGRCFVPYFLALLAEAYVSMAHAEEGLTTVAEALAIIEQTHEGYMEAELHRLKGELQSEPSEAEACFERAIEIARRQKAKSFELRALMSVSRLYHQQGRPAEARQRLAEIYYWFAEGFDSADLKKAATLLQDFGVKPDTAGVIEH